ncbi:hypothetical protein J1P26_21180 [Neobacillus sp. MM2021_6]|uniref:hypothetical protein n=1 Tax=Bacillaceae TaxID=186817 RepID=UPI00140823ED|nr:MULTISPECIES: hypothetical protein [Bacillaceae]MBO0962220.1 hypothetical protein [Neobacillus sp. MM2021_6]NHC18233.1 hypothetical protein [Bacillus sp. MM2020_4]WML40047.1 hypothetical protein RCG19_23270 [Neobacillus sp. OS1-2]
MKYLKIVIPVMVIVAVIALWMLGKYHAAVQLPMRILIAIGGALLSGIVSFTMLKLDVDRVDTKTNK